MLFSAAIWCIEAMGSLHNGASAFSAGILESAGDRGMKVGVGVGVGIGVRVRVRVRVRESARATGDFV